MHWIKLLEHQCLPVRLAALVCCVWGMWHPSRVFACVPELPDPFAMDSKLDDGVAPPEASSELDFSIKRGQGPKDAGCWGISASSCDDLGFLEIRFTPPLDDNTPAESMGYRVTWKSGQLPNGMLAPPYSTVFAPDGLIRLYWDDGATDEQEPLDFTITLTAIDAAGNEGPPSKPLHIRDAGSHPPSGCGISHATRSSFAWVACALWLLWRRRDR